MATRSWIPKVVDSSEQRFPLVYTKSFFIAVHMVYRIIETRIIILTAICYTKCRGAVTVPKEVCAI
jgi:hypothetical protein